MMNILFQMNHGGWGARTLAVVTGMNGDNESASEIHVRAKAACDELIQTVQASHSRPYVGRAGQFMNCFYAFLRLLAAARPEIMVDSLQREQPFGGLASLRPSGAGSCDN